MVVGGGWLPLAAVGHLVSGRFSSLAVAVMVIAVKDMHGGQGTTHRRFLCVGGWLTVFTSCQSTRRTEVATKTQHTRSSLVAHPRTSARVHKHCPSSHSRWNNQANTNRLHQQQHAGWFTAELKLGPEVDPPVGPQPQRSPPLCGLNRRTQQAKEPGPWLLKPATRPPSAHRPAKTTHQKRHATGQANRPYVLAPPCSISFMRLCDRIGGLRLQMCTETQSWVSPQCLPRLLAPDRSSGLLVEPDVMRLTIRCGITAWQHQMLKM